MKAASGWLYTLPPDGTSFVVVEEGILAREIKGNSHTFWLEDREGNRISQRRGSIPAVLGHRLKGKASPWTDRGNGQFSCPHELGTLWREGRSGRHRRVYWLEDAEGNRISNRCSTVAAAVASVAKRKRPTPPPPPAELTDEDFAVLFGEIRIAPTVDLTYATTARELLRAIQAQLHPSRAEYQVAELLVGPLVELLRGIAMDRRYPGEEIFSDLKPLSPAHIPMYAGVPTDIADLPTAPITWRGNR